MKVIIAVDDSPFSEAAVKAVISRPWWGDTEFLVLNVVQIVSLAYSGPAYYPNELSALREAEVEMGTKLVKRIAEQLRQAMPFAKVEYAVDEGSICHEIVERAKGFNADLIVLGSHGRKGLNKFLLGSVAETVVNKAPCSVEIIKIGTKVKQEKEKKRAKLVQQPVAS